jgi:hypothetical protein
LLDNALSSWETTIYGGGVFLVLSQRDLEASTDPTLLLKQAVIAKLELDNTLVASTSNILLAPTSVNTSNPHYHFSCYICLDIPAIWQHI